MPSLFDQKKALLRTAWAKLDAIGGAAAPAAVPDDDADPADDADAEAEGSSSDDDDYCMPCCGAVWKEGSGL